MSIIRSILLIVVWEMVKLIARKAKVWIGLATELKLKNGGRIIVSGCSSKKERQEVAELFNK